MALRQHLVEISIAFLIAGCIFVFYDSPTLERPTNSPFNVFNVAEAEKHPEMKKLPMVRLQNCSNYDPTAIYNVTYINTTSGQTVTYQVNASAACAKAPTAPVTTTTVTNPFPYVSVRRFFLTMNLDCAFGAQAVIDRISRILLIQPGQIVLSAAGCGSLTMSFTCSSAASVGEADEICDKIVSTACTPNSLLNQELKASSCGVDQPSGGGSSTSLYALFALMAIPILLCACVILWYRSSQREADNQYMQDTATFSNVAASPQPLGTPEYPPTAATYTQEGYVPAAQTAYAQPIYPTPV